MHKSFRFFTCCAMKFAAIFFLLVSSFAASGIELPHKPIEFTGTEKAYIAQVGVIKMCVDPDWAPFESINGQGQHVGIAADLVQTVAKRVGLHVELYPVKNWEESLTASKSKRCQVMSFLNQTPAREAWLAFTDPIFSDPNVIITREEHGFIADAKSLRNETVALPRGTMVEERVRLDFPNLKVVLTESEPEAMVLVSERKVDMTIRSLIVAANAIKKEGLFNLKISGQIPQYTNELRIGVLKDDKLLLSILNKGVQTITPQEREAISNKHVLIHVQKGIDYRLVWQILGGACVVLLIAIAWNRKLSELNKELARLAVTDRLTGLFNRVKLDEAFEADIQRAIRFKQPFSIVILDIDHFKEVNDTHGHQVGDQVLVEVARLIKGNTRDTDIAGRWGGEEFLVICVQTDAEGVLKLAENLRLKFLCHNFPVVQHKTASLGVTTYCDGDKANDMVARVDEALYVAKNKGRNRVEVK